MPKTASPYITKLPEKSKNKQPIETCPQNAYTWVADGRRRMQWHCSVPRRIYWVGTGSICCKSDRFGKKVKQLLSNFLGRILRGKKQFFMWKRHTILGQFLPKIIYMPILVRKHMLFIAKKHFQVEFM